MIFMNKYERIGESIWETYRSIGYVLLEMGPEAKRYRKAVRDKDWEAAGERYGEIPVSARRMRQRRDAAQRGRLGGDKAEDAQEEKIAIAALKKGEPGSDTQKKAFKAHLRRRRSIGIRRKSRWRQANDAARGRNANVDPDDTEWEDANTHDT